ncbi:MAG: hypothetical protein ACRCWB_04235 [Enterovibrio sp.]
MQAKLVFANNMSVVAGNNNIKELVKKGNDAGISIDYTYVMNVRRGLTNPSIEKSEQIVQLLQMLPTLKWIELWMFFIPDYFTNYSSNIMEQKLLPAEQYDAMVAELLVTACRLQFITLDSVQLPQMQELARYIFQKENEKMQNAVALCIKSSDQ